MAGGNYPWALIIPQGRPEPQIAAQPGTGVGEEKGPAGEEGAGLRGCIWDGCIWKDCGVGEELTTSRLLPFGAGEGHQGKE